MPKIIKRKPLLSLRWKFAGFIMFLAAFFFTLILLAVYYDYQHFIFAREAENLSAVSAAIARRIESEFTEVKNVLSFVATHNRALIEAVESANAGYMGKEEADIQESLRRTDASWDRGGWEGLQKKLVNSEAAKVLSDLTLTSKMPLSAVFITDRIGALTATTQKVADYYHGDEEWWQKGFNGGLGSVYFSAFEYDEDYDMAVVVLVLPIMDAVGQAIGILKASINIKEICRMSFDVFLGQGSYAGVMNEKGADLYNINFSQEEDVKFFKPLFDFMVLRRGEGRAVLKTAGGAKPVRQWFGLPYSQSHKPVRQWFGFPYSPSHKFLAGFSKTKDLFGAPSQTYIYCLRDYAAVFSFLKRLGLKLFLLWFMVILWLCGFGCFLSKKLLGPLYKLKEGFGALKNGVFTHRVEIVSGDELENLAQDFNDTVSILHESTVSKEHFNRIIQSISDMLFVVNASGSIELVNQCVCDCLGYRQEELKGKEAAGFFSKKDRYLLTWGLKGLIEEVALKDKRIHLETKSGREVEVYLGMRSIKDSDNNLLGLVCLAKDLREVNQLLQDLKKSNQETLKHKQGLERSLQELTEVKDVMLSILEDTEGSKKALEETLKKLKDTQEELLQAEKMVSLGQIAAGIAHEINNPLFVISGEAEMMAMEEDAAAGVKESVKIIREQVSRVTAIIKRLFEFSSKKESVFTTLDVNLTIEKTIDLLKYQVKFLGYIDIVRKMSSGPCLVYADQNQLQEVFLNLMINAIQAMEEKGGVLTIATFSEIIQPEAVKRENSRFKAGQEVVGVRVCDTGNGMDEKTMKRIFDPFFTTKKSGTGLGLSVCFGIVENHNGLIEVESNTGKGTVFTVRLPKA